MASGGPVRELCEEVTCPICLEYFKDPATIAECGHSFCRACLTRSWGESGAAEASCPQCRGKAQEGSLRPNRQLANIVEITRKLSLQEGRKEEAREKICEKHREHLKLFCQTDEILLCWVCDRSKEHKSHEVIPAEEAAQEYKDKIFNSLETLRTEREKILEDIQDAEDYSQEMLDVRGTLQRYEKKEKFVCPKRFPSEQLYRVHKSLYNPFLASALRRFKDILRWAFPKKRVKVILDPASASPHVVFSFGQEIIEWRSEIQDASEDPEKHYGFVLGREGFTAGCHFWEVSVGHEDGWAVGVVRKPVRRGVTFTPEEGIWAVGRWKGQYKAFIEDTDLTLTTMWEPDRIRICLNYDEGTVAFYDASTTDLLNEFTGESFSGDTLYPFFAVYDAGNLWVNL